MFGVESIVCLSERQKFNGGRNFKREGCCDVFEGVEMEKMRERGLFDGKRGMGELMRAPRASESSKRLEKHPGRGLCLAIIYTLSQGLHAADRLACACAHYRTIRNKSAPWLQPPPLKARRRMTAPKHAAEIRTATPCRIKRADQPTPPDTLTARRAGLALAAPRLPLAAGRGRKAGLYNH